MYQCYNIVIKKIYSDYGAIGQLCKHNIFFRKVVKLNITTVCQ